MTTPGPSFGQELRRLRERARVTQADLADKVSVARATLSQWEAGRHLPTEDKVRELDRILDGRGELQSMSDGAFPSVSGAGRRTDLHSVYDGLGRVVVDHLVVDDGALVGWRRDFRDDLPVSAFSTMCAIRTLAALPDPPYVEAVSLRELVEGFHQDGGWATRGAGIRPETTAVAIDVLARLGASRLDHFVAELELLTDRAARSSTYVLSEVLGTVGRLRPQSPFCERLVRDLLDARRPTRRALWPEKTPAIAGIVPQPSMAHTARAIIALRSAVQAGVDDNGEIAEAVEIGATWLVDHGELAPVRENLEPIGPEGRQRDLEIRHATPALVARALSLVPDPPWPTIDACLERLWALYSPAISRWTWPNGDVPLWLQYDAVSAIRVAADRSTVVVLPDTGRDQDDEY